jgi:translation initiation factor IF-2
MPDKNIVDDYYSQMDSSSDESISKDVSKKPTIVAKKKIIVKKPQMVSTKEGVISWDDKKIINKKPFIKRDTNRSKWIVQKIEVIKREDNKPKKFTIIKRGDPDYVDKTKKPRYTPNQWNNVNRWNNTNNSNTATQTEWWIKFKLRSNNSEDQAKKFGNNKKAWTSSFSINEKKRSKLAIWDRRTRWRLTYWAENDWLFVRSNKVNKKEEKNIEDIKQNLTERKGETIIVPEFLSLKELSEKIWVVLPKLMAEFMKNWMMVNINSQIDFDSASIIAEAFEIKLEKDISRGASVEDIMTWDIRELLKEEDSSKLLLRTPVVSIMWHVDHGKTSLLDYIREAKVASWESGWITQSIWAYQVETDNGKITFLDTPGHEAFTIMRARWAKSTDIAILVVAADEWVKPQTIESINHAKEAGIPIIVAINKMDKGWANPDHIKGQLAENGLTAEDWGGDIPMIPVSAITGFWIDDLLEIILLTAEMQELKANPNRAWIATVIESHLDQKLWPVATVLVNTWTIYMWDNIVCQDTFWKIKVLKNYKNQSVKFVIPWEPALIVWLDKVVDGWDILQIVNSVELAKQKAEEYRGIIMNQKLVWASWLALLMSKIKAWNLKQLKIILKADTNGSLEAIKSSLLKLSTPETTVQIIHAWVWSITEWDILMGQWSEAILVWYNVWVLPTAKGVLESSWVEYISSKIIYHITERIEKIVTWMLDPKEIEIELWKAKVWGIFFTWKWFMILGLKVAPESIIEAKALVRIIRKKKMIWTWIIESLKSWTIEVKELEGPIECWIHLKTSDIVEMWDDLEIHKVEIGK